MLENNQIKKRRIWPYVVVFFLLLIAGAATAGYFYFKSLTPEKIFESTFVQDQVKKKMGEEGKELFSLVPEFLGFTKPHTYLFLFQNNTEMRPAGGFIGVYGVLKVDKGQTELVVVEGTETLDKQTPKDWKPIPPKPLVDHLKVDRWYFRDSNWSPDFSLSAKKALEFYKGENGKKADDIDTVIAFTPTVLEELMKVTGPFTISGINFTAENVIEKLEYQVEYGYENQGLSFENRKQIIQPFMIALMQHVKENMFKNYDKYFDVLKKLASEKHILIYSSDKSISKTADDLGWHGKMNQTNDDYLMWVDANLAALKTDHAMKKTLSYSFKPTEDGKYLATISMLYENNGKFDWRTTRYRTYARVYLPLGSEFIKAEGSMKTDRTTEPGTVDLGEENGRKWFGTFISIEPQTKKTLSFSFYLSPAIVEKIKKGEYNLFVQKQNGTVANNLTLNFDFGIKVQSANPTDQREEWDGKSYNYFTDLREDRLIEINLQK